MVTKSTFTKFGFEKDKNNLKLKEILKHNTKFKEVHIDTYPENPLVNSPAPFMLLLRTTEKNVKVSIDENRLVFKRNDLLETYFVNVLFKEIRECYYAIFENYFEFILKIQNIYYRITIFN